MWGVGGRQAEKGIPDGLALPPRLTRTDVAAASRRFGAKTMAVDGLHPREVQWLSETMLDETAWLLRAFKVHGLLGGHGRHDLVVRLIPKPSGGSRPVILFRTLFRVWGKARACSLQQWAATALAHPPSNNFSGRRPGDGVWRSLMQAEAAEEGGHVVPGGPFRLFRDVRPGGPTKAGPGDRGC